MQINGKAEKEGVSQKTCQSNYSTRLSGKRVGVNQILLGSICYTFSFALSKKLMF
jgi:hypothetical protein